MKKGDASGYTKYRITAEVRRVVQILQVFFSKIVCCCSHYAIIGTS